MSSFYKIMHFLIEFLILLKYINYYKNKFYNILLMALEMGICLIK